MSTEEEILQLQLQVTEIRQTLSEFLLGFEESKISDQQVSQRLIASSLALRSMAVEMAGQLGLDERDVEKVFSERTDFYRDALLLQASSEHPDPAFVAATDDRAPERIPRIDAFPRMFPRKKDQEEGVD
jgi:hypothetical protein